LLCARIGAARGGFPVHIKVRRCWQLEDHQNASDVEKGARRRTMRSFVAFVAMVAGTISRVFKCAGNVTLIWSQDSKWCAFYYAEPRVGYTTVYRENGKKFSDLNAPEALSIQRKVIRIINT